MEYRYLGRTGLQVSTISIGAWVNFDPVNQARPLPLDSSPAARGSFFFSVFFEPRGRQPRSRQRLEQSRALFHLLQRNFWRRAQSERPLSPLEAQ
jgi:hypothetical protein